MDTEIETNGTSLTPDTTVVAPVEKPWVTAGFKTRAEWRASKKADIVQVTSKHFGTVEVEVVAPKAEKKLAKKAKKPAAKMKAKKPEKALKAKSQGKQRRTEPSLRQAKVLSVLKGDMKIEDIAKSAFPGKGKSNSWTRNQLRWLRRENLVRKIGRGLYRRVGS